MRFSRFPLLFPESSAEVSGSADILFLFRSRRDVRIFGKSLKIPGNTV